MKPEAAAVQRLSAVRALSIAAAVMLIPANFLPVMTITTLGRSVPNTILSGVVTLCREGLWGIGVIVLIASFVVPLVKLLGLILLLFAARGRLAAHRRGLVRLYRVLEFIGRWSMLDVFLVVFLAGLVQLGVVASVRPGPGIVAFAASVVLTMLATQAYDPRVLWKHETTT